MYLGIEEQTGLVFEGSGNPNLPALPLPSVTQAKLISRPEDWNSMPSGLFSDPFAWIFREDSFDAVTRIRRGRIFQPWGQAQPSRHQVMPHPYDQLRQQDGLVLTKSLHVYATCTDLLSKPNSGQGLILGLGSNQAASSWRIVQVEMLANRSLMLTLKALTAFGMLPEVDDSKVGPEFAPQVRQAITRVVDAAFRETPISVIDHCRNALTVLISRWLVQQGCGRSVLNDDLGKVGAEVGKAPHEKGCISNVANVVARLHSRGKANEQHAKGLRIPNEGDAEVALQAVGFVLREIDWALP